jgi:hypothetical protein
MNLNSKWVYTVIPVFFEASEHYLLRDRLYNIDYNNQYSLYDGLNLGADGTPYLGNDEAFKSMWRLHWLSLRSYLTSIIR